MHEIERGSGTQFDPDVVAALGSLWRDGELARFSMHLGQVSEPADFTGLLARSSDTPAYR